MALSKTLIMASGGLRSLVSIASVLSQQVTQKVYLLHLRDGRANARIRFEYTRKQAQHYKLDALAELEIPHLKTRHDTSAPSEKRSSPLLRTQILMIGLSHAIEMKAASLVFPVQCNRDFDAIARITEQVVMMEHIARLDHDTLPRIDMPLIELTDQQMIELGGQLGAPLELGWTCLLHADKPCRICAACRARRAGFDAAGMLDPADQTVATER